MKKTKKIEALAKLAYIYIYMLNGDLFEFLKIDNYFAKNYCFLILKFTHLYIFLLSN